MPAYTFKVIWDPEASVAEAPTLERLHEKLLTLIPEMLKLNHSISVGKTLSISLETHREFQIA